MLLALALAACGPAGTQNPTAAPAPPAATAAPTSAPTAIPTALRTAAPEPTIAPTAAPQPTSAPTAAPTTSADPTPAPSGSALPNDVPWFQIGKEIHGDDELVNFEQQGLPIPAFSIGVAPDGSDIAYTTEAGKLAVVDTRTYANHLPAGEDIGDVVGYAFSPDSRSLALTVLGADNKWFLRTRDIASGTTRTIVEGLLYANSANDPLPLVIRPIAWTPAGLVADQVLWASDAPARNLTLVNLADASSRMLRASDHVGAAVSHDGAKIAVITGRLGIGEPPQTGLSILDTASGQEQVVLPVAQRQIRQLRWSPDGARLLYAESPDYQAAATTIGVLSADGSNRQSIEVGAAGGKVNYADVAWLDNQTTLLLSPEANDFFNLYALPLSAFDSASLTPLAAGPRGQADPATMKIIYTPGARAAPGS
jgi:hypothetical protein